MFHIFGWVFLFVHTFLIENIYCNVLAEPIVKTKLGLIRGINAVDGDYSMYMGIPFARVNSSNPFGAALPQEPFDGIFDAFDDSAICPQIEEFNNTIVGSLDCLQINIYVPNNASPSNPVPVMAMIFGGAFTLGFPGRFLYGPKYLVRHDVILVTFNYRLGPYGFMCLQTPEVPGNTGLKDQLLALRWIKENIGAFGGDSGNVTILGHSAGGFSVDYHLYSPLEKLYNKVILQSGTALSSSPSTPIRNAPVLLANHLGFDTDDINEAISLLAQIEPNLIIAATKELGLKFLPCIEKEFEGVESFFTTDWMRMDIPKVKNMPVLLGHTDDEAGSAIFTMSKETLTSKLIDQLVRSKFNASDPGFKGMDTLVRYFYVGDNEVNSENLSTVGIDFGNALSDIYFIYSVYRSIGKYLDNNAGDIYYYLYSYVGGRNFIRNKLNITSGGAVHADELGYLYDISYYKDTPTVEDQLMIDRITALWTNFAKSGNPTPERSDLLPVEWKPIRKGSPYNCLHLDKELSLITRPFYNRMAFWDLFYKANDDFLLPIS